MKRTQAIADVPPETVLVTFIRQAMIAGDTIMINVWDGTHYVGSLRAGTLLQYRTTPGEHLFLGSAENWSYSSGNLVAGKQYFIKGNMFPGIGYARVAWGVAAATDERIPKWRKLKAMAPVEVRRARFEIRERRKVLKAIKDFKDDSVNSYAEIKPEHAL